jgi:hypothetical protein
MLPLWFVGVTLASTLTSGAPDRTLLLGLPALAALAAFALPTLKRQMAALIDWFTLLFFSGCGFIIWVVWIAMQTGIPKQPAANVARLVPGFEHSFSSTPFLIATTATLAWTWLVKWRVGRHRSALWKSLVLPAGGAALCWLLLMTLWLPLLDFARSYAQLVQRASLAWQQPACIEAYGLSRGQIAAFQFHGHLLVKPAGLPASCPWLVVDKDVVKRALESLDMKPWELHSEIRHPADPNETLLIYKRAVDAAKTP